MGQIGERLRRHHAHGLWSIQARWAARPSANVSASRSSTRNPSALGSAANRASPARMACRRWRCHGRAGSMARLTTNSTIVDDGSAPSSDEIDRLRWSPRIQTVVGCVPTSLVRGPAADPPPRASHAPHAHCEPCAAGTIAAAPRCSVVRSPQLEEALVLCVPPPRVLVHRWGRWS